MPIKEISISPQGNDMISMAMRENQRVSPIQTLVFNPANRKFIPKNTDEYITNNSKVTQKIAQMVGHRSDPKNTRLEATGEKKLIKLHRFHETTAIEAYEIDDYQEKEAKFLKAWNASVGSGLKISQEALDYLNEFKETRVSKVGLNFGNTQHNGLVAFQNAAISRGVYEYQDAEIGRKIVDYGVTRTASQVEWADPEAKPLTQINEVEEIFIENRLGLDVICMGRAAARNFLANKTEVAPIIKIGVDIPGIQTQSQDIIIDRQSKFDAGAGYQHVATYRGIPIYTFSKKLVVPNSDGQEVLIETFDENAVSFLSLKNYNNEPNFRNVHKTLYYVDDDGNTIDIQKEVFAYIGGADTSKKRLEMFCESFYAPIVENSDALYILNVG